MASWNFEFGLPHPASAYDIAVEQGFEGTEQEWLESLQGEDGQSILPSVTASVTVLSVGSEPTVTVTVT